MDTELKPRIQAGQCSNLGDDLTCKAPPHPKEDLEGEIRRRLRYQTYVVVRIRDILDAGYWCVDEFLHAQLYRNRQYRKMEKEVYIARTDIKVLRVEGWKAFPKFK